MSIQERQALFDMLRNGPDLAALPVHELRKAFDQMGGITPVPTGVSHEAVRIGDMPAEWSTAADADPSKVVLYLHGGGYVIGSIASHRGLVTTLGKAAGSRTLAIDYRLAPEHPFPAPVEDALAAYRWLLDQGYKPGHITVAGDSAGGGLTVAALVAIRDAGLPLPAAGFCISPWIDMEATGASMKAKVDVDPMVKPDGLAGMVAAYLGGADPRDPRASPLHADLNGLPPLLIQVGSMETLLDDSTRLAAIAGAADVKVRLEIWPGLPHVWHLFAGMLTEGREALASAGDFLKEQTA
ncbi:alpha/beta hydrolase [Zavarzinia sp. CC-PAN008]|uniref:alpha/beta hydrolase n=1 Tax=Zavarzinia sp. CC-PAN008 TaxID=3243332 RepID=UPI003F749BAD